MSDQQSRLERDLYDHQDEQPTPSGRRRPPVADWGVGDELFEQMPRRRFSRGEEPGRPARERRPAERPDVPRGPVDDGRPTLRIGSAEDVPSEIAAVTADRDLEASEAGRRDLGAATADRDLDAIAEPAPLHPPPPRRPTTGDPTRRTVKIEGRPEGALSGARFHQGPQRLRPGRSVGERMGARPDRLAAWAFALGLLLIVIAVLSSLL